MTQQCTNLRPHFSQRVLLCRLLSACGFLGVGVSRVCCDVIMSHILETTPLVEILDGTTTIALRSIASKLVSHQELGKVFSLFGVAETMMPLVFAPLYSRVYILTLHVMPGAVFLLTVLATIPAVGIFIWFYSQHKKDFRQKRSEIPSPRNVVSEA